MPISRILRERKTVEAMIRLYCHDHHGTRAEALCSDCQALTAYAGERLARCPFQENKTVCAKCRVHCYKAQMREGIREVMRYAGEAYWICSQCCPVLIHHPERLSDKLPHAEQFGAADEH